MEKSVVRKFRKRPVTIEAMQITNGESVLSIAEWIDSPVGCCVVLVRGYVGSVFQFELTWCASL